MTDVVTCSPDCDYCGQLAEFQCGECGAYACVDHIYGRACWRCHEAAEQPGGDRFRPFTPEELEEIERRNVSPLSPDEEAAMAELFDRHLAPAFRAAGVSA